MSDIVVGQKAIIIKGSGQGYYHGFKVGSIVTFTGYVNRGTYEFRGGPSSFTQVLKEFHFQLVDESPVTKEDIVKHLKLW